MLSSKPYTAPLGVPPQQTAAPSSSYNTAMPRKTPTASISADGVFTSPTESEFSEAYHDGESVRSWDEMKVIEWLHSIRCGQYESLFKANHFNGDNLLECDQKTLQEMGIKKIGDRVRIFVAIKQLRNKSVSNRRRKNRDSLLALSVAQSQAAGSPAPTAFRPSDLASSRAQPRQLDPLTYGKPTSRPTSPFIEAERGLRAHRYGGNSPAEVARKESGPGYFSHPSSAGSAASRRSMTPGDPALTTKASSSHLRSAPSIDGLTMGALPASTPVIRVIYTGGQTKVLNVKNCKNVDEIFHSVLKKLQLPESYHKLYCFWILEGLEPTPANAHVLTDAEVMRICDGSGRPERGRLILRKIQAGEPDMDELRRASQLAADETQVAHMNALSGTNMRNQIKIQKLTGESWHNIRQPMSPISAVDRGKNIIAAAEELERPLPPSNDRNPTAKLRSFFGARPPSEMIIHELPSYFPSHQREDIEKTMRMSVRRSQRMSRAASRLSVVSNISMASTLKDAPPIPSIADTWLNVDPKQQARTSRPLSVYQNQLAGLRDSVASSSLHPLREEVSAEPDRKSYVSFDSSSEPTAVESSLSSQAYLGENLGPPAAEWGGSLHQRLSLIVAEDGEEEDDGLNAFLAGDNFNKNNWMKGSLIGEGSFGRVFLALHAITGELMAVKQVELPSATKGTEFDQRKNSMVTALKHEIDLLQGLRHDNIVQYLGTSTDEQNLNIFLEYVPGGSIAVMLQQYNTFQEPLIKNFVRQILAGLSYLHSRDIIHRDIKGANVLVDNKGGIKISDFGISKRVEASNMLGGGGGAGAGHMHRPSLQGSVYWMAPEVVRQTAHTKKADIWSLGCLVVEMFIGAHPFPDCSQLQAIFAIGSNQARPPPPENASEDACKFLDMTFEVNYEKRPTADELLECKFLANAIP